MSSHGKKRAWSNNSQSRPAAPTRQGSSFSPCPACRTAVHAALMDFHLGSCSVVVEEGPVKKKNHGFLPTEEKGGDEIRARLSSGSPEFSLVSSSKTMQGFLPEFAEDVNGPQRGRGSASPPDMGASGCGEKLFDEPETPIQEAGRDRMGGGTEREASEGRKRLFEGWGELLSPESESEEPLMVASVEDSQSKRVRVTEADRDLVTLDAEQPGVIVFLGVLDSAREDEIEELETQPYLGNIRDSQEELEETAASSNLGVKIAQVLGMDAAESEGDGALLRKVSRVEDGKVVAENVVSQREMELESALRELREKHSELEQALKAKNEECEQVRRRELGLRDELLAVRRLLETHLQVSRGVPRRSQPDIEIDEELATQILSQTSNLPVFPRGTQDQLATTRASSENTVGHKPAYSDDEEQATQLLTQGFNPGISRCLPDSGQNSQLPAEHPRSLSLEVSSLDAELPVEPPGDCITSSAFNSLAKVDKWPARRLFGAVTGVTEEAAQSGGDEPSARPLQSSARVAGPGFAPRTPGKALQTDHENEKSSERREGFEIGGGSEAHFYNVPPQQQNQGTPGGPKTPQRFPLLHGGRDSGLINDLLGTFPPAQGAEPQPGIDPFDVNGSAWNVADIPIDPFPLKDVQTLTKDGGEQKLSYNEARGAQTVSSEYSDEDRLLQTRVKNKRRKAAIVIDSDSDKDIGYEDVRPTPTTALEDLRKGKDVRIAFEFKIGRSNSGREARISNAAAEKDSSSPDSVMKDVSRDTGGEKRFSSSPSRSRARSGLGPDPIIEDLSSDSGSDKKRFSTTLSHVVLSSSEGEENVGGGSPGSDRKRKCRRLVKIKESTNGAEGLQPGPEGEAEIKREGTQALRRSSRLSNRSTSKPTVIFPEDSKESNSDAGMSDGSGTHSHGEELNRRVLEFSFDSGAPQLFERRKSLNPSRSAKRKKNSEVRRDPYGEKLEVDDDDDDGDDDDSSFINDDLESDADSGGQSRRSSLGGDESSNNSGGESEGYASSGSNVSSGGPEKKFDWQLEGDMLAALSKDQDLCMRGLCALFRRQEVDEQHESSSKYRNKRGFDKFHATKASNMARFMLGDSDSTGPVVKTSAQLELHFGENALAYCENICKHHSKQLFEIFQTDEDPYFP